MAGVDKFTFMTGDLKALFTDGFVEEQRSPDVLIVNLSWADDALDTSTSTLEAD